MLTFLIQNDRVVLATDSFDNARATLAAMNTGQPGSTKLVSRHELKSLDDAEKLAREANLFGMLFTPAKTYLATDAGGHTSPRFDVIEAPRIGDRVSAYFNGDSYPEGTITKISDSYRRIETSTGKVFWRRRNSGSWISGRTWSMSRGWTDKRNPSF